ncbi:MAG: glutathione S-transferase family protein [Myxococcales bacterium]
MKLYDVPFSSNCRKVRIAAAELELPLELVPVEPRVGGVADPAYRAKNPMGKVPTLEDGGLVLWESTAICDYLASKRPERGLAPTDAAGRADMWRWLAWFSAHLQPWASVLAVERVLKPQRGAASDEHVVALAERELARFLPVLEAHLAGHGFLLPAYSIADICVGCGASALPRIGIDGARIPATMAWIERLEKREAWRANPPVAPSLPR